MSHYLNIRLLKKYLDLQFKLELMIDYIKLDISIRINDESYQGFFFFFSLWKICPVEV